MKFPQSRLDFWALFSRKPWLFRSWRRFAITALLVLVTPATLLLIYTSRSLGARLERQTFRELEVLASVLARQVSEEFFGFSMYIGSFASRPTLVQAVEERNLNEMQALLAAIVQNNHRAERAIFTDAQGVLLAAHKPDPAVLGKDFSYREWFKGAAARESVYVSGAYRRSAFEQEPVVMVATPVRNASGTILGYLGAQRLVADINEWIDRTLEETSLLVAIVDQNGEAICDGHGLFPELQAANQEQPGDPASFKLTTDGAEYHVGSRRLPDLGWTAYVLLPAERALRPMQATRALILTLFATFVLLLAGISLVWVQTLYRYARGLERSTQHLEYFCYSIAHNFRAPLRAISGFAALLREKARPVMDIEGMDYIDRIARGGQTMDEFIKDLLLFGKISHADISAEPVDLSALMPRVINEVKEDFAQTGASLTVEPSLGSVYADRALLQLALRELLCNAGKFTVPGRAHAVRVSSEARGSCLRIWIHDNGRGIEPEHQDQIFELFSKLELESVGTGVGLALARNAVERMAGSIGVRSTAGEGSSFWIELPCAAT